MQANTEMSTKDLLTLHNARALAAGLEPIKSWKSGKDKLAARIADIPAVEPKKLGEADAKAYAAAVKAIAISARDSIQVASEKLLEATAYEHDGRKWGIPYAIVLQEVKRVFPDCRTTLACLRWYAVRMNEVGTKLPKRQRSPR